MTDAEIRFAIRALKAKLGTTGDDSHLLKTIAALEAQLSTSGDSDDSGMPQPGGGEAVGGEAVGGEYGDAYAVGDSPTEVPGYMAADPDSQYFPTELTPWEEYQKSQQQQQFGLQQQGQEFEQGRWGQEFGRQGEQWGQEFDLEKAVAEAGLEDQKWQQRLEEDKWKSQKWALWNQMMQDEAKLRGSFADKASYIQSGLAQRGTVPQAPSWMGEYGVTPGKGQWDAAGSMKPLGAQAGAELSSEQKRIMGATARWQGLEGYGSQFGGAATSPMQTSKRW